MSHHAAFALPVEFLDIVVIEDSKPMQAILRSMLVSLRARRVRVFETVRDALEAMLREPPNLIVTDWRLGRNTAYKFVKMLRTRFMAPLCFVPVIVVTAHATTSVVDRAMRAGVHLLVVKPLAPMVLFERIRWLATDARRLILNETGTYVIEGMPEKLRAQQVRADALRRVQSASEAAARRRRSAEPPPLALTAPEGPEFLPPKAEPGPLRLKSPAQTLRNMPRINHFAALRNDPGK